MRVSVPPPSVTWPPSDPPPVRPPVELVNPFKANTAPAVFASLTEELALNACVPPARNVPPVIVVAPEYVLAPLSVTVPVPDFVSVELPEITPEKISVTFPAPKTNGEPAG